MVHRLKWVLAVMLGVPVFVRAASPLDAYLLKPDEVPASCQRVDGFFPVNEKTAIFYDYQTYRSVLPTVVERHVQSFDCGGQKGSLYFFAYADEDQAQQAELFAKPVLTRVPPAPLIREWATGFVVVSFADPPKELLEALEKKCAPPLAAPPSVFTVPILTLTVVTSTSIPSAAIAVSTPVPIVPPPPPPPVPDLSDDVIKNMMKNIPCSGDDMTDTGKAICGFLRDFLHAEAFTPVISSTETLVGASYLVDRFGAVAGPAYVAAVGSGRAREIFLVPIFSASGVDDIEAQALVDERRAHQPLKSQGEILGRIARHARPEEPTLFLTTGRSLVMPMREDRNQFLRRRGDAWILIGVSGSTPEDQMQSTATIEVLY